MTDEERYVLRGHYVLESQRETQGGPEPETEPEPEPGQESEQPVKASFPKGKQAGG